MKNMALIIMALIVIGQCHAQSKYPNSSTATTITTSIDTLVLTTATTSFLPYELLITNRSTTDTLQWRTDNETVWKDLLPASSGFRSQHINAILAKKIFRRTRSGSLISDIEAN